MKKAYEHQPPRPGNTYVIGTERETNIPYILATVGPSFTGSSWHRKGSVGWYKHGHWDFSGAWTEENNWKKSPFFRNITRIQAKTVEEAFDAYRLKVGIVGGGHQQRDCSSARGSLQPGEERRTAQGPGANYPESEGE